MNKINYLDMQTSLSLVQPIPSPLVLVAQTSEGKTQQLFQVKDRYVRAYQNWLY